LLSNNSPIYTEKELLLQVAEGDEKAFRQLYLQWHQLLAGYVFRITESRELTEEIVQDVLKFT
jgi:RNA polymerase sigma-70 factor (ECF subfamily)